MDIIVKADEREIARVVGEELCALVEKKPNAVICMAAGHSSLGVFEYLVQRQEQGTADFSRVRVVELDEWAGMDASDPEGCTGFLYRHFFNPMGFAPTQLVLFNAKAGDQQAECRRMAEALRALGGIDYMLLGMGQNGHLGLNEPGCDLEAGPHITQLSETTKQVGQKYFSRQQVLTGGITLGMADILATRRLVMVVSGEHKREIAARFSAEAPGNRLPASMLKTVPGATVYLDPPAAGLN